MRTIRRRYALEQEIGRGASGSVWTALDLELGRRVAIKLLRSDALENAPARERFESEARTIALLRSPHVVQVYDAGVDDGEPFIVMELLHGESLEARLSRHPQLPFEIVTQLVSEIAKGLRAVHRAAVVHRDLKPANIFLCREPDREVVKILDFGISALLGGTTAEKSALTFMGTPQYMSPEQYRGGVPEPPSDLWALGVVTYRMLVGRTPFDAASLPALQDLVEHATYRPASECRPELPSGIDAFFKRAFAPAPRDRFGTALDLAAELASLKGNDHGRPIRALFVDDESDMEILLKQRFRREVKSGKYEILFADSGEAALEELRRRPDIDVVLTDLNMPGMHGLTLLERIPEVNPLVRVVVLSAYSDMANIRAAMNQGAFDFLGKPIDFGDLTRTIDKSAATTHLIRQELASREENDVLRALIGRGLADRLVTLVKAADRERYTTFEGTVVWVDLPVPSDAFARGDAARLLELLNLQLDDIVPELVSRGGSVTQYVNHAVMTVFQGEQHAHRALEACLALESHLRLRTFEAHGARGGPEAAPSAAIGVDSGLLIASPVGSLAHGCVSQTVLGSVVYNASRLARLANANEILISARARKHLPDPEDCELDASRVLRDADGAQPVYRVVRGARSRDDTAPTTTVAGPRAEAANDEKPTGSSA